MLKIQSFLEMHIVTTNERTSSLSQVPGIKQRTSDRFKSTLNLLINTSRADPEWKIYHQTN